MMILQQNDIEQCSEVRRALFEALKINQSLKEFYICGTCTTEPSEEEGEYFKQCLLENYSITYMEVPWDFAELKSILARNARIEKEKRFNRTKMAIQ